MKLTLELEVYRTGFNGKPSVSLYLRADRGKSYPIYEQELDACDNRRCSWCAG
jgi:hypothetical protein